MLVEVKEFVSESHYRELHK
ncbi:hypothetical protein CCACVL1_00791 [Corchorus capsularis]|uniref:Uncharacterized protein n=1 Tax=Corchorus capsularis TaxID=210143 RepID=A0A1R3KJU9_COCAP|nr:hypothetical protein CCACVL1_01374 [Corchorus capsularis]OMP07362.1 hypothetical protein CCACVL1_01319 [Corchorus capsularis]OMP10473.1 hypothetical protein CCACVL1_00955 [Corchorus capsularis]OMP10536.1 hypothetical protein CCACVL1_00891 [Corchorus capsularis]OMP10788.1 hypothetical protein CCACVL1_00791 [Corchorus capsularis]